MNNKEIDRLNNQLCTNIPDRLQDYMKTLQFFDDNIADYIYIYDLAAQRVYFTDKIRERFPLPLESDNGMPFSSWNDIVHPKDRKFMDYYRGCLISGEIKSFSIAYRIMDYAEKAVWVNVKGTLRQDESGNFTLLVGLVSEATLGRMVDSLTGLCSTEKFMHDLKEFLNVSDGYLMVLGVDSFKNINITRGRTAGDNILRQIAAALEQHSEYSAPAGIYRLDGDCFAVIFPSKQRQDIIAFYQAIQEELQGVCTISAGAVFYQSNHTSDSGELYQYAESALDQAKKQGKNMLVFFSQNSYQRDLEEIELLDEIKANIRQGCNGFYLCYQPQINSQNFDIYGVEALLRYHSPSRGNVSPAEFIPLLEKSGLICQVGELVLKAALAQCKEWRKKIPHLRVSVNLSHAQLQQSGIADMVLNSIRETGLPGEALMLEVTESIQLQDYTYLNKIFYIWKHHGIKISIDDFGTGYSSLSYLKSIEIDEIKIDKCFVHHVQYNAYNYRLLKNMIELAHSAKINVCCEGVETLEEFLALQELHTDLYQGYLFAKPCTKEQFEQIYLCAGSKEYQERKAKESKFQTMEYSKNKELLDELRKEEISNITESMEELVYVSDIDTYELYYLNATGRRISGVYDYKGCKCYQVLQGRNTPCEFCTTRLLKENEFHVWEHENKHLERNYILKDKLIRWQGKIARLEIAIDITQREIVSKSIQKKLDFEETIVEACTLIASENDADKSSWGVLKIIGEFCQADRVYILKPADEEGLWDIVLEWCAEGVEPIQDRFSSALKQSDIAETDQKISVPIKRKNKVIGFVEVENPRYKKDGNNLVKTMAYFLGYGMIGDETQKKLSHLLESRHGAILKHTGLGLWEIRINPDNGDCKLYPDHVLCKIMELEEGLSSKDSYKYWYSRIKDGYHDYVNQSVNEMARSGKIIHLEYPWISPTRGEIMVQCVGTRREDCDGMICLEGYHCVITS